MKKCFFLMFAFFIVLSIHAEKKYYKTYDPDNIYDPDSLVVIALLDSNDIPHSNFQDITWMFGKFAPNDSDWKITRLYLRPEGLPKKLIKLPPEIGNLFYLNWLDLPNNDIQSLPNEVNKLQNIKALDLRYNPVKTIQPEIAQCSMIDYLGLAYTDINHLPDEFLDLGLRPCNTAIDTINGAIYPDGVIDLCGLENFTLTERQKQWADVEDYEEYKQKYCQQSDIVIPEKKPKTVNPAGIAVKVKGYAIELTLEREGLLSLSLFDSKGKKVRTIIYKKIVPKGSITIQMDRNISAGVYFLRGRFSGVAVSKKIIIEGGI